MCFVYKGNPKMTRTYGWKKDRIERDNHTWKLEAPVPLPVKIDLTVGMVPCYDQGDLGSCTANAIIGLIQYDQIKQKLPITMESRLRLYYDERALEGTIKSDAGAEIADGFRVISTKGFCAESIWPYDIAKFAKRPPASSYSKPNTHKAIHYQRVPQNHDSFLQCLAKGNPIVIGFNVYEGFESEEVAKTGIVQMPLAKEQLLGGHAILTMGYDQEARRFKVRNSWGTDWGQLGYFTVPFDYFLDAWMADQIH